jgi:hypothetical protein
MNMRKSMNARSALVLAALAALLAAGCASGPKSSPELAAKFVPAMEIAGDESLVYVIRQKTMMGAGMPLYLGLDSKIAADLASGTYFCFKLKDGIHTVSLEQNVAFNWVRVDRRAGQIVFLYFQYDRGIFSEVDAELGKTLVAQTKPCAPWTKDWDCSALSESLVNPSLVGLELMKAGGPEVVPDAEHAVVTFYRTKDLTADKGVAVWCDREFLGNLPPKAAFRAKVGAGRRLFYSGARWSDDDMIAWLKDTSKASGKNAWVTAELEAGKEYFVNLESGYGKYGLAVVLAAAKPDDATKAKAAALKQLVLDEGAIDQAIRERLDAAKGPLETAMSDSSVKLLFNKGIELKEGM